jgi:cephalosporin hydroxylase
MRISRLVDHAFTVGVFQHREELQALAEHLDLRLPRVHALEIGTLHGGTAALWGELYTGLILSVDLPAGRFGGSYFGYTEAKFLERNAMLQRDNPRFRGILGNSHDPTTYREVCDTLNGESVDLLFIDGDHAYAGVEMDYTLYRPFVRAGGAIVFHDINDTPKHRLDGCEVADLWAELPGEKVEFSINAEWGGIGVLHC